MPIDDDIPSWVSDAEEIPLSEYHEDFQRGDAYEALPYDNDRGDAWEPPVEHGDAWEPPADRDSDVEPPDRDDDGRFSRPARIDPAIVLSSLNQVQQGAVSLPVDSGPVMVLAGAGTGKTATLTRRIAWLVSQGVHPSSIMAVTFTNKAAKEMRERLKRLGVSPMPVMGTFHSIGLQVLRMAPSAAGASKGFTIMDEQDTKGLFKRLFVVKPGATQGRLQFQPKDPKIDAFADAMFGLKEKGYRSGADVPNDVDVLPAALEMLDIYEKERESMNLVDFSDLISASLVAIRGSDVVKGWAGRFTHMLVDEFQDTSHLQFEWVQSILQGTRPRDQNLFCVGDDCQSIYSFRGAVVENVDKFIRDFGAKTVMLEQNYRCGTRILDAANCLIAKNRNGDRKKLWAEGRAGAVDTKKFPRDSDESDWIARDVRGKESKSAVLVRTRAAMVPVMQSLRKHGLVYHAVGAHDFFASKEVKDMVSLLRMAANPHDKTAFVRAAALFDKVGKTAIDQVLEAHKVNEGQYTLMRCCEHHKSVSVRMIAQVMAGWSSESCARDAALALCEASGLKASCEGEPARLENLKEFMEIAGRFEKISELLEEMTLFSEKREDGAGVTISTIHAAKGLEWDRVYLPAMSEGHMPSAREDVDMEEERRLMYVALTRAKNELSVSWSKTRMINGSITSCMPSRFIRESGLQQDYAYTPEAPSYAMRG